MVECILVEFDCKKHGIVRAQRNGNSKRCSICNNERMRVKHQDLRNRAIDYGGGECKICGYSFYKGALDFHHLDPSEKDFTPSKGYKKSWEKLKKELDKCILLCSNCHREVHAGLRNV